MKRRIYTCIGIAMLLACLNAPETTWAATIKGPTEVPAGTPAVFTIVEIPVEYLDKFNWQVFNAPEGSMILDLADRAGNPVMMFWSKTAARCAVIADVNVPPDGYELLIHEFTAGEPQPEPEPDPDPEPEPEPEPAPPGPARWGVIIEERDDRDDLGPTRSMIFEAKQVRDLFAAGQFQVRDDDVLGAGSAEWKPYIEMAREKIGLPAVFLLDADHQLIWAGPLPDDVPAMVKLVKEYQ